MAAPGQVDVFHLNGSVVSTPTNLAAAYPHGGTILGNQGRMSIRIDHARREITAEEFGGRRVDYERLGESARLTGILRSYDADAIAAIFPNTTIGTKSRKPIITGYAFGSSFKTAGSVASDKALVLLFSPNDREHLPSVLFFNAIPLLQEAIEIQLKIDVEFGFGIAFDAAPDASGRLYAIGMVEDLTL